MSEYYNPDVEAKLVPACSRLKESAAKIRRALMDLSIALDDIRFDASVCDQLSAGTDGRDLMRRATKLRGGINKLDFSSVTIPADRMAEDAWEKRYERI